MSSARGDSSRARPGIAAISRGKSQEISRRGLDA
jgi:hypothetical protein